MMKGLSLKDRQEIAKAHTFYLPTGEKSTCTHHIGELMIDIRTGSMICSKCFNETNEASYAENNKENMCEPLIVAADKAKYFRRFSVFQNDSLKDKGFEDYESRNAEIKTIKDKAIQMVFDISAGKPRNIYISGNAGVGKTALSAAMAKNINAISGKEYEQRTVLFYSFSKVLNMIRDSYNNPSFKKNEAFFIQKAIEADCLIIDDIAAETPSLSNLQKMDFSKKILFTILDGRVDTNKSTIVTSNFGFEVFEKYYEDRIASRLSQNLVKLTFIETADQRKVVY